MRLFVPGRLCLLGEHSDWAGAYRKSNPRLEKGYALIAGTDQGIRARIRRHPGTLRLASTLPDGSVQGPLEIPMNIRALLREARRGGFFSYVAGVAYQALSRHGVDGLALHNDRTDLPLKKGLSSSAAVCVLAARAFNRIYELGLSIREEMELAYQGEITTPSRCGRMDQGCAFGGRPVLMIFDGDRLRTREIAPARDIHLVLVDLRARKDTVRILERLHTHYPLAADEIGRSVQDLLGPVNRRLVAQAARAVQAGDAERLGLLMREAQRLFDRLAVPACPEELTAPALHRVLDYAPLRSLVWGGKGVGSQGDGAAQFVARGRAEQRALFDLIEKDLKMPCLELTLRAAATAPGA